MDESQRILWHAPTEYDALKHGPSYLPPKGLTKEAKEELRVVSPWLGLLAALKAAALIHQTHHWSTSGNSYYGDHLLFERLYDESQDWIDQVAERAIGTETDFHIFSVDLATVLLKRVESIIVDPEAPQTPSTMVGRSLRAERFVLNAVKLTLETFKLQGKMSPGISNLLEGVYDKHETFVYLLKQRQKAAYNYDRT